MTLCVIALGGNIGNTPDLFRRAAQMLSGSGFRVRKVSRFYTTEPVDCPSGTPPFLNAVLDGFWSGTAVELLDLCQSVEQKCGRPADHAYHTARTIDLDIILFGSQRIRTPRLTVPHPSAKYRSFVLTPFHDLESECYESLC